MVFFLGIGPLRVLRKTMDTVVPRIDYRQLLIKVDDIELTTIIAYSQYLITTLTCFIENYV